MTNNERTKVLDRIRKLLAMAEDSGSPEEAAIAASRARKLMDKHQIEIAEAQGSRVEYGTYETKQWQNIPNWAKWTCLAVAQFNSCIVDVTQELALNSKGNPAWMRRLRFRGEHSDVIMCEYMMELIDKSCLSQRRLAGVPLAETGAFQRGFANGICWNLERLKNDREKTLRAKNALVLVDRIKDVEEHFGEEQQTSKGRKSKTGHLGAMYAGQEAGRNLNMGRPIGDKSSKGPKLLS